LRNEIVFSKNVLFLFTKTISNHEKRQKDANDVQQQLSQVENMISGGCNVLVIAAIEGSSLGEALDMAKDAGIPVIAYDRLLMDSDAVSYYATFDNYKVGQVQGQYVIDASDFT